MVSGGIWLRWDFNIWLLEDRALDHRNNGQQSLEQVYRAGKSGFTLKPLKAHLYSLPLLGNSQDGPWN